MRRDPFVLPALPGEKTLADNLEHGALFEHEDGVTYSFRGILPDGRWGMYSLGDEPKPMMMADEATGFPAYPTHRQVLAAMAAGKLGLVSSPLDSPARIRARGQERTKAEVTKDDPFAQVRMSVCRLFDKERPARDDASLEAWRDARFDWTEIKARHGREKPPASTIRSWINKRGRVGNRCWADMEDCRGQGPRRKRVGGHRLAIAVWHAISYWTARRHPSVSKLWKDVEADTRAYNTGKALIMHAGKRVWPRPSEPIAPADPEFFRHLVKRLESRNSYKYRYSAGAAQQHWEGGGGALEPTRFLEVVQQDETEAPTFFFIDAINRVALGTATWVIAVDIYTRCILAWDLSFDAPSVVSWMRNVLNASRYKPLPTEYAERFPELATIGGRMSSIIYDNPSHLIGHAVEDAHGDLVQDVIFAGEGQPTHKAVVERTHETLRTMFAAELPGAKMQIALAREFGIDASKDEKLLTLQEGRLAMARAVCKYHTELKGDDGRVPLDRWVEQWNRYGPQHARDQEQYARAIGNVSFDRALDNGGVRNYYLGYSDVQLTPLLMEAYAARTHRRRRCKKPTFNAKVKWDPTDMSSISVFDPVAVRYRKLPAKMKRYTAGLTFQLHKLVMRYRGAKSLLKSETGEERLLELRRLAETKLKNISAKMEAREKRARAAITQQPVIREMMGGDIHLLEVAPSASGMEVQHDLGMHRKDMLQRAIRGKRGSTMNDAEFDVEDADEISWPGMDAPAAHGGSVADENLGTSTAEQSDDADHAFDGTTGAAEHDDDDPGSPDPIGMGDVTVGRTVGDDDDDDDDIVGQFKKF